jgi:hypothetical protein
MQTIEKTKLRFVALIIFLLIFILLTRPVTDADLWWHLRAGQVMLEQKQILLIDVFSYTQAGVEWVNAFWISEILLYAIYIIAGYFGLTFFVALIGVFTFYIINKQILGNLFINGFILILATLTAAPVWSPRPQILSFLLIAILNYWLTNKRSHWFLIPLFTFWANIHGGWIWGFLLLIAHIAGEAFQQFTSQEKNWAEAKSLIGWSIFATLAIGLNPNGLAIWILPFQQINVSLQIQEWLSPDFHRIDFHPFLWMIFLLIFSAPFSKKPDWIQVFKVLGFAYLTFFSQRNIALFAIVSVPLLSEWMNSMLQHYQRNARLKSDVQLPLVPQQLINAILILILILTAIGNVYLSSLPEKVNTNYPVNAIQWIKENKPKGNLFNSYNWGGYLIWALPEYPVFIDGRADLYGNEIINQWAIIVNGDEGAFEKLDKWNIDVILIEPYWDVVKILEKNPDWQKNYQDEKSIIFIQANP